MITIERLWCTLLSYFLLLVLSFKLVSCKLTLTPMVTVEGGILRGTTMQSRMGQMFYGFQGIRYGTAKRFQVPVASGKWHGVKDAIVLGSECAYILPGEMGDLLGVRGSEDCLFLNVYTPKLSVKELLPVIVYIHGGAFVMGSGGLFGPVYFLDEEVVLVTINYRMGALGFLYFEDESIPGNLGLRDQILSLHWVQKNIRHFGGDPRLVTIYGHSAGGYSVAALLMSSLTTGPSISHLIVNVNEGTPLKGEAIPVSGSVSPAGFSIYPRWHSERFASKLECGLADTGNTTAIIECLKKVDLETLIESQIQQKWGPIPEYHWAPVAERILNTSATHRHGYVLTAHPMNILASKKFPNKVPLMTGVVKNEGVGIFAAIILKDEEVTMELNQNWTIYAPPLFLYYTEDWENPTEERNAVSRQLQKDYFGNGSVGMETRQNLSDMFSHRYFIQGTQRMALAYASEGVPVYSYYFTFNGGYSFVHMMGYEDFEPPSHGDDIPYLFPTMLRPALPTMEEIIMSQKLIRLTVSFAKYGKPVETWGPEWSPLRPYGKMSWYKLDQVPEILPDIFGEQIQNWDNLMNKLNMT